MNCDFLFFRVSCVQQKIVNMFIYIPYARWLNIAQVFSFAHTGIESPCVIQLLWWKTGDQKLCFLFNTALPLVKYLSNQCFYITWKYKKSHFQLSLQYSLSHYKG